MSEQGRHGPYRDSRRRLRHLDPTTQVKINRRNQGGSGRLLLPLPPEYARQNRRSGAIGLAPTRSFNSASFANGGTMPCCDRLAEWTARTEEPAVMSCAAKALNRGRDRLKRKTPGPAVITRRMAARMTAPDPRSSNTDENYIAKRAPSRQDTHQRRVRSGRSRPSAIRMPEQRIELIVDLFSDDATWEGVGPYL